MHALVIFFLAVVVSLEVVFTEPKSLRFPESLESMYELARGTTITKSNKSYFGAPQLSHYHRGIRLCQVPVSGFALYKYGSC